jgi:hypothetical protein
LSGEAHERLSKVTCRAQLAVAGHDPDALATPVASPRDVAVQRWWNGARELWLDAAAHPLARNGSSVHAVAKKIAEVKFKVNLVDQCSNDAALDQGNATRMP